VVDRAADRVVDRAADRVADRVVDRVADRVVDRVVDPAEDMVEEERPAEKQVLERQVEGPAWRCRVAAALAPVHRQVARGPEASATAGRHLFREWSPVLRAECLEHEANPRKKNCLEFSAHLRVSGT
jgi:hypothetical protein